MDDDEFDFSDSDLDDLPANTLQQLETTAILATQRQHGELSFDRVFDVADDDEVWDPRDTPYPADDASAESHTHAVLHHAHQPTQQPHATYPDNAPVQSQVDVGKLLERIKKVNTATDTCIDCG